MGHRWVWFAVGYTSSLTTVTTVTLTVVAAPHEVSFVAFYTDSSNLRY